MEVDQGILSSVDEHWLNELPIEVLITIVAAFELHERTEG